MPLATDTLVYDSASIAVWQANPAYQYNRDLMTSENNLSEWLTRWLRELLQKIFGTHFSEQYIEAVFIGIAILMLLLVVWFLYRKRPELFMRTRTNRQQTALGEETIDGIDFPTRTAEALAKGDYREAIRWVYLHTLKHLSDSGRLNWKPFKTPTEYLYEVTSAEIQVPFRNLTRAFLQVRYGNFEASESLFREMKMWQSEIRTEKGATS